MKKLISVFFVTMVLGGLFSLHADITSEYSVASRLGLSDSLQKVISFESMFGTGSDLQAKKSGNVSSELYSTGNITFQYTTDGWLQHVAIYPGSVICTNIAGPREGTQFIIANNGALIDMCHFCTKHKNYFSNKYIWGEVKTYENYQTVKVNKK